MIHICLESTGIQGQTESHMSKDTGTGTGILIILQHMEILYIETKQGQLKQETCRTVRIIMRLY